MGSITSRPSVNAYAPQPDEKTLRTCYRLLTLLSKAGTLTLSKSKAGYRLTFKRGNSAWSLAAEGSEICEVLERIYGASHGISS